MPIRITKIEVNSCGPILNFNKDISTLTLIYAENEKGKTTIVENIIASLFKKQKDEIYTHTRGDDFVGSSRITVSGISDKQVEFNPRKKDKIDNLLENEGSVLPKSLFSLLFVKGAETEIIKDRGGISKTVLKNLFSKQQVYELVDNRLPTEISYTDMVDGIIIPQKKTGKHYRQYEAVNDSLKKIQEISDEFHSTLSRTSSIKLQNRKRDMETELEELKKSKRHYAFMLNKDIYDIKKKLSEMDDSAVEKIDGNINEYFRLKGEYNSKKGSRAEYKDVDESITWLEKASGIYNNNLGKTSNPVQKLSLVVAGVAITASVISFFFKPDILIFLIGTSAISLFIALLYTFFIKKFRADESALIIIDKIQSDFKDRFERELKSPADLETVKQEIDKDKLKKENLDEELDRIDKSIRKIRSGIELSTIFSNRKDMDENKWKGIIEKVKAERRRYEDDRNKYSASLRMLGIDETDFLEEPASVEYSVARENEIEKEIDLIDDQIEDEKKSFDEIRRKLSDHQIGSDIAFSDNLEAISIALDEKMREYKETKNDNLSAIIAGHVVSGIISEFKEKEDEQLEVYVNDKEIVNLVKRFTGSYDRLSIEDEDILVGTDEMVYKLKDMSTGAQEQILLAFRMGIAKKLTGKDSLFLILDDAFQYSDWNRRQYLIDRVVEIVNDGWQVIYFTMDEDIKRRFVEAGKKVGKGEFRMIEL